MSWLALGAKIAGAIGSIATAYSVGQIAPPLTQIVSGVSERLSPQTGPVTTTDAIKNAEHQAQNIQTITGTDNPQSGTAGGLPDQHGTDGKLLAALAALGLGAGAIGGVALGRRIAAPARRARRPRRRRTFRRRFGGFRRRRFGRSRRRGRRF